MKMVEPTKSLLALIAFLLAVNVAVWLVKRDARADVGFVEPIHAANILMLEEFLVTTNEQGNTIYIWKLGRRTDSGFDSVYARVYHAPGSEYR